MSIEEASQTVERVRIENVNHPGKSTPVDGAKYRAMRSALLEVLPGATPGFTENQMREAVTPKLPEDLFPGGARVGWWAKAVQLDLEAKGELTRELSRPIRWHRAAEPSRPSDVRTSRDGGSPHLRNGGNRKP